MTAAELKASILDRAVHGLLVPQDPNDEPAAKSSTVENPPYDLPRGWVWVRLGCLVTVISGTSYKSHDVIKSGIRIFRGGNIQNGDVLYLEDDTFLPECFLDSEKTIREGDVLIVASTGSKAVIGKPGFVKKKDSKTQIGAFLRIVRPLEKKFIPYIWLIFKSEYYRQHIRGVVQGMNINNVKNEHLTEFPIPLPPLAEQKRIVEKIEELMPLVEEYGKAETELAALNDNFPTALRKSILQHAVEGRLTAAWRKANPRGETAAELLAKIAAEKKHLLASGKIKKQKPFSPITDDEKPFPIPDSWAWVRLGEILKITTGNKDANYGTPNGKFAFFTCAKDPIKCDGYSFEGESIILAGNGDLSNISYYTGRFEAYQRTYVLQPFGCNIVFLPYLLNHLRWNWVNFNADKTYGSAIPYIRLGNLQQYPVVLPPLAEQKAIVERVEELLGLVEKMKE